MLLKNFFLYDLILPFKGVEQIKRHGAVPMVIPNLDQIHSYTVKERRVI